MILDQEHLQSGNGIEGDEIVQEQTGVHPISAVASTAGTDIDDDGTREHSNIHIGERQWGADPTDGSDTPYTGFTIEADFVEGLPNQELNTREWERGVEDNLALYGLYGDMNRDDTIETSSSIFDVIGKVKSTYDIRKIDDEGADINLVAATTPPGVLPNSDATGVNIDAILRTWGGSPPGFPGLVIDIHGRDSHAVFTANIDDFAGSVADYDDYKRTPYTSELQLVSAGVELHEIGHSLGIGEADDTGPLPIGEVYSGNSDDDSPEVVRSRGRTVGRWSIMRSGWGDQMLFRYSGSAYHVFSLEELSTIDKP